MSECLCGNGAVSGIAIGQVRLVDQNLDNYLAGYEVLDRAGEAIRVQKALAAVAESVQNNVKTLKAKNRLEQAAIMEAHQLLIEDPVLAATLADKVQVLGSAPRAVLAVAAETAAMFEAMEDEYFRERAADIRDIGNRLAKHILGVTEPDFGEATVILCGEEIEPSLLASLPTEKIAGVILGQGSTTCHAVIIAKARDIPTVVGMGSAVKLIEESALVVIDGETGEIVIAPAADTLAAYRCKQQQQAQRKARYAELAALPAETTDGWRVELMANISGAQIDDAAAKNYGAEGVGLFRSEFVFMGRDVIPSEETQFRIYKKTVENCQGKLCVIRTMDIGGDKPLPYLDIPKESNPFLGWRAIRISLERQDIFLPQLKAILRAGAYGRAAIMLPMVVNVAEIKQAREIIEQAKCELMQEGKVFAADVPVGIMVETPAAAVMTPVLAKYVDFFSIGTNDLVQYTLAVDRVNHNVSYLYDHFNPAVLRLIQRTIEAARDNNIWAGMCGEMASDPYAAVLLMAMGINELSMSGPAIPQVKEKIRSVSSAQAKAALAAVLELEDGAAIKEYLYKNL